MIISAVFSTQQHSSSCLKFKYWTRTNSDLGQLDGCGGRVFDVIEKSHEYRT